MCYFLSTLMCLHLSNLPLCNRVKVLISNDIVCEVHLMTMKVIGEENTQLGKDGIILVFWHQIFSWGISIFA